MFLEIDNNKDLLEKYSKYELVNLAFILLKKEKKFLNFINLYNK